MVMIDSFLIKLGFDVDKDQEAKFKGSTEDAGKRVANMGKVAAGAMVAMGVAVLKASSDMSKMGFTATRIGASANKISALEYAFKQVGGETGQATSAMMGLHNMMTRIGKANFAKALVSQGIPAIDKMTGKMRDMSDITMDIAKRLKKMSPEMATAVGQNLFGFDPATIDFLRSGELEKHYDKARKDMELMGVNFDESAKRTTQFMNNLNSIWSNFKAFSSDRLTKAVGGQLDEFSKEFPKILGGIGAVFDKFEKDVKKSGWWEGLANFFIHGKDIYDQAKDEMDGKKHTPKPKKPVEIAPLDTAVIATTPKTEVGKKIQQANDSDQNGSIEDTGDDTIGLSDSYKKHVTPSPVQAQTSEPKPQNEQEVTKQFAQNADYRNTLNSQPRIQQGNLTDASKAQVGSDKGDLNNGRLPNSEPVVNYTSPQAVTTPNGEKTISNSTTINNVRKDSHDRKININQTITVNGGNTTIAQDTARAVRNATQSGLSKFGNPTD